MSLNCNLNQGDTLTLLYPEVNGQMVKPPHSWQTPCYPGGCSEAKRTHGRSWWHLRAGVNSVGVNPQPVILHPCCLNLLLRRWWQRDVSPSSPTDSHLAKLQRNACFCHDILYTPCRRGEVFMDTFSQRCHCGKKQVVAPQREHRFRVSKPHQCPTCTVFTSALVRTRPCLDWHLGFSYNDTYVKMFYWRIR